MLCFSSSVWIYLCEALELPVSSAAFRLSSEGVGEARHWEDRKACYPPLQLISEPLSNMNNIALVRRVARIHALREADSCSSCRLLSSEWTLSWLSFQ
jgi:hypothetical protein